MAINITCEDNMEMMSRYPDKYFDLAIVDPEYGINEAAKDRVSKPKIIKKKGRKSYTLAPKEFVKKDWDKEPPPLEYFQELFRVSKNQIIFGANHFIDRMPKSSSCWIVWDKINGDNDFADCELAWTSFKSSVRLFRYMWAGFMQSASILNPEIPQGNHKIKEKRIHPTQKPVALYKWLIDKYAKQGDKILDTHLGSGSIAIACHDYGFDLTACELDKDYYEASMKRLKQHQSQTKLF